MTSATAAAPALFPVITLTEGEQRIAASEGVHRYSANRGGRDRFDTTDPWRVSIEGAAGEIAVAKYCGLYWSGVAEKGARDVGEMFEVRTRTPSERVKPDDLTLTIQPKDPDAIPVILAINYFPRFEIRGWILAGDGKAPELAGEYYRGGGHCWNVPQFLLRPAHDLRLLVTCTDNPSRGVPMTNSDPDLDPEVTLPVRHPAAPITLIDLAARKSEGLEILDARATILATARAQGIRLTSPADYVLFKAPDGNVTAYLQDAGAQRVRDIFGIVIHEVSAPEKLPGAEPGSFHYIITGSGLCKLTGQTCERLEGGRSSNEDFCKDKTGVDLDLAVRKAARANLAGNITRELAGLKTIPIDDLTRAWAGTGKSTDQCHRGRGFGTADQRLGMPAANVPPPTCPHCNIPGVLRPAKGTRSAFYGCRDYAKHPKAAKPWIVDAAEWAAKQPTSTPGRPPAPEAPAPAPAAEASAPRTGPCEICGLTPEAHANADHDYDGGQP